jgi:hypothetical protein
MGTLPINSIPASFLFNSAVSHSFIYENLHSCITFTMSK